MWSIEVGIYIIDISWFINGFSLDREWYVILCVAASCQRLHEIDSAV